MIVVFSLVFEGEKDVYIYIYTSRDLLLLLVEFLSLKKRERCVLGRKNV